jgi:hypothetical protein
MTLYLHKFNDRTQVSDGLQPVLVPAGWLIADVDADDVRVCMLGRTNAWSSPAAMPVVQPRAAIYHR